MPQSWQALLQTAEAHAQAGRFEECLSLCGAIAEVPQQDRDVLLQVGSVLHAAGFLFEAQRCFERIRQLDPADWRGVVNLANVARDAGDHAQARRLYAVLLEIMGDEPVVRRNALSGLEYDPEVSDAQRLLWARAWGDWAVARAGGARPRPARSRSANRPLRIGYVSGDFCQHTVGLFFKDVLAAHDPERITAFAYSAGRLVDWVTEEISANSQFRRIADMDDRTLVRQIRTDAIDLLLDLSGHTGGSRLTAFAYRPAPVQLSWLGYPATTGLPYIDAVLLDQWHTPVASEDLFVETVLRLPAGRLCYRPVPWAPEPAPPPCLGKGFVTFGSFNNTAKLNPPLLALWADLLRSLPRARLVLKWRSFNDPVFRAAITSSFAASGIAPERIELRPPSFHRNLLAEYADIDIALDPFPFSGALTSCEALWMGVPIVTWPQRRAASRQTYAFLAAIGLAELVAQNAQEYVAIAAGLAADPQRLAVLRGSLRSRMAGSPLCDLDAFIQGFEAMLMQATERWTAGD